MIERFLQFLLYKWQNRESLKVFGAIRDRRWRGVRAEHLKKFPNCALCGGNKIIEVHHKKMFSQNPELELSLDNLITLCESGNNGIVCHRAFGHLGNYKKENPNVEEDVKIWNKKLK